MKKEKVTLGKNANKTSRESGIPDEDASAIVKKLRLPKLVKLDCVGGTSCKISFETPTH